MTPHPLAHILRAIAEGQAVQFLRPDGRWVGFGSEALILDTDPGRFRIKPRTISINGHEVPEPVRKAPGREEMYFMPYLSHSGALTQKARWLSDTTDVGRLVNGLVHLSQEAAEAHAKALLSFTSPAQADKG